MKLVSSVKSTESLKEDMQGDGFCSKIDARSASNSWT